MKYTFIGTGVANVFCAVDMINKGVPGNSIRMIDSGKNPYERERKEVMQGFMGAGAFSDFKVLYSLVRGGELVKYVGEEKANSLIDRLKTTIRQFHPNESDIAISGEKTLSEPLKSNIEDKFDIIQGECEHIGTDYAIEIGKRIYDYMKQNDVDFHFDNTINDISFENQEIHSNLESTLKYDELIIGTGKSGMRFLNKLIDKYDLKTDDVNIQLGVRFESQYKYFKELAETLYDFKLHKKVGAVDIRTFCVNNKAAFVAKEDNEGLISYNGHAYRDESKYNGLTNFGVMMEFPYKGDPLKYAEEVVKKNNVGDKGLFYSPGNRKPTADAEIITDLGSVKPPIFNYVFQFIKDLDSVFKFGDDYGIYVPEIKYLTNGIKLKKDSMSLPDYNNIHIIGDNAGARGIFVSSSHGLHLSDYFKNKNI